jgi:PTS system glucitol/sorbitol-specific IIB component
MESIQNFASKIGSIIGKVVGTLMQAGRETIELMITTVLPFMAFVAAIIGLVLATGFGDLVAGIVRPLASNILGLLVFSIVVSIPFIAPFVSPGGVMVVLINTVIGVEISKGNVPVNMALPALFAWAGVTGADFIPVALSLAEAEPETVEIGVPALLISRQITGPIGLIIGWLFSFGMYS